jgi:hypothetical protein
LELRLERTSRDELIAFILFVFRNKMFEANNLTPFSAKIRATSSPQHPVRDGIFASGRTLFHNLKF